MFRFICSIIFLLYMPISAEAISANYDVSYGVLGKIGTAKAVLKKEQKSYTIDIKLATTGLARLLSSGRKEHHISQGHMENGLMVSDFYQVIKSHGDTVMRKEYRVDHKRKKVKKHYRKFKKGVLVREEKTVLDFYAKDDLLTLYFNLNTVITDKTKPQTYGFKAVGAERQKGKVTVIIPTQNKKPKYEELLGKDATWYATAIIHQKIFSSKEGRLMLAVGKDGITNKAVLKDVIFFGDIRAVRVK